MKYYKVALSAFASSVLSKPAEIGFLNATEVPEECFWQDEQIADYLATASVVERQTLRQKLYFGNCPNEDLFKGVGDNCHSCTCFCDARPDEESCLLGTRDSYNADIFMPYGDNAGDTRYQVKQLGVFIGPLNFDESFLFYGREYKEFYFSSHGFIHFRNAQTQHSQNLNDFYNSYKDFQPNLNMIAPFWSDFNLAEGGQMWYRVTTDSNDLNELNSIVQQASNFGFGGSAYNAKVALIVTLDSLHVTGTSNDKTNTFQAIVTHDGTQSYVIFHYGDIEQDAGTYTAADGCTGLGGWSSYAAIRDEHGNVYHLDQSHTEQMENIDQGSNVQVRGRYMIRVDGEEVIAPSVQTTVTQEPTTISSTNIKVGIEQFLAFKEFDYSLIAGHGCYCSVLSSSAAGEPSDDLDKICRSWINARRCSLRNGGECFAAPDTNYNAGTENCVGSGVNDCDDAACGIDEYWFNELESYFTVNQEWAPSTDVTCTAGPSTFVRDSCCGSEPATMTLYSSDYFTCDEGELSPIIEGF